MQHAGHLAQSVHVPLTICQPEYRLHLLGAFRLEMQGRVVPLPRRKVESLLAYLALRPEPNGHLREKLP